MIPNLSRRSITRLAGLSLLLLSSACASRAPVALPAGVAAGPGVPARVDLERFMGDWWVVGHIPTGVESNAAAAIESYTLRDDGIIDIRYSFCDGADARALTELEMTAWVHDETTNAEWRVQPFWPLHFDYVIAELAPDYSHTVIVHPSTRWAWIMARKPGLDARLYAEIEARLRALGFDTTRLRQVPPEGACRPVPQQARP